MRIVIFHVLWLYISTFTGHLELTTCSLFDCRTLIGCPEVHASGSTYCYIVLWSTVVKSCITHLKTHSRLLGSLCFVIRTTFPMVINLLTMPFESSWRLNGLNVWMAKMACTTCWGRGTERCSCASPPRPSLNCTLGQKRYLDVSATVGFSLRCHVCARTPYGCEQAKSRAVKWYPGCSKAKAMCIVHMHRSELGSSCVVAQLRLCCLRDAFM